MDQEINPQILRQYVEMRARIDAEGETIYSLANLLGLSLRRCEEESLKIDPIALGHIQQIIERSMLKIWSALDDFIGLADAKLALDTLED